MEQSVILELDKLAREKLREADRLERYPSGTNYHERLRLINQADGIQLALRIITGNEDYDVWG